MSTPTKGKGLFVLVAVLIASSLLFTAPQSAMAQQITATTIPPLTLGELEQQRRLQDTIDATTRNLEQGEKEVNGIVYTPRWSNPVWVEADSLSILFAYCLPGEFAESGQEILGGSQLEVLESYALALTGDLMVWFAVVENEDEQDRLPAAVGVICASDLNQADTRVLSPEEQTEINNIIQQFITIQNTQVTNIENVINIINNVTRLIDNQTDGVTPRPPAPPIDNQTDGVVIDDDVCAEYEARGLLSPTNEWTCEDVQEAIESGLEPPDAADDISCYNSGGYQANRDPGLWGDCVLDDPDDPSTLDAACGVTVPEDYCRERFGWIPPEERVPRPQEVPPPGEVPQVRPQEVPPGEVPQVPPTDGNGIDGNSTG